MVPRRKALYLIYYIYILSVSLTGADLLLGGTASDLEIFVNPAITAASANDGNLNCNPTWFHSGCALPNDWLNVQTT